jgi:hypothetical protein
MDLFVSDPNSLIGYKVSDLAKAKYQGAITCISNTPGKWIPPRLSHTPIWTQKTEPLGSTHEMHALFLHQQGQELSGAWKEIEVASIAIALGMTPD